MKIRIPDDIKQFVRAKAQYIWFQKLNVFYRAALCVLVLLFIIRISFPVVTRNVGVNEKQEERLSEPEEVIIDQYCDNADNTQTVEQTVSTEETLHSTTTPQKEESSATSLDFISKNGFYVDSVGRSLHVNGHYHKIGYVSSYEECFPDSQNVHIVSAERWGVVPPKNRAEAERRKRELVYVGASPYYQIDREMSSSIPYLVPRASELLNRIGRNFYDSLYVKGLPLHKVIVTSVLRSDDDVARLSRGNVNATRQSCHRYGTTFDISWARFQTVNSPGFTPNRTVRDDTLKFVLSEVLRDLRESGACHIKHERMQSCFHITVR